MSSGETPFQQVNRHFWCPFTTIDDQSMPWPRGEDAGMGVNGPTTPQRVRIGAELRVGYSA